MTHVPGIIKSMCELDMGWKIPESNPGVGEIFRTHPDRPWVAPSLLYKGYRVSFRRVKWTGRGLNHPHHLVPRLKKE
jgi:hypothetical protein